MKRKLLGVVLIGLALLGLVIWQRPDDKSPAVVTPTSNPVNAPTYTPQELLASTNALRPPSNQLTLDPELNASAQRKCEDLAEMGQLEHGTDWQKYFPSNRIVVGENLAEGSVDSPDIMARWINSPAHYKNLVDARFTRVGFGICTYQVHTLVTIVVQHFSGEPLH